MTGVFELLSGVVLSDCCSKCLQVVEFVFSVKYRLPASVISSLSSANGINRSRKQCVVFTSEVEADPGSAESCCGIYFLKLASKPSLGLFFHLLLLSTVITSEHLAICFHLFRGCLQMWQEKDVLL